MEFRFNPKDRTTIQVLRQLGLPETQIRQGHLSVFDPLGTIVPQAFEALPRIDDCVALSLRHDCSKEWRYFSPNEARQLSWLLKTDAPRVQALFNPNSCPGKSHTARDILLNMMGRIDNSRYVTPQGSYVHPEVFCSVASHASYRPTELAGIHYADHLVPEDLRTIGQAVGTVHGPNGGSAVVISDQGDILTAYHVLFDTYFNTPRWTGWWVTFRGKDYGLREEYILFQDPQRNIVHLRLPDLGPHPHLRPARRLPDPLDPIWVIGSPSTPPLYHEWLGTLPMQEFSYTIGQFVGVGSKGGIVTSARAEKGYSGGAIVTPKGELLAITTNAAPVVRREDGVDVVQRSHSWGYTTPQFYDPVHWRQIMTVIQSVKWGLHTEVSSAYKSSALYLQFRGVTPQLFESAWDSAAWQVFFQTLSDLQTNHIDEKDWVPIYKAKTTITTPTHP